MTTRPQYIVFAGVNGAGKSTFYRTLLWAAVDADAKICRVNPDEIIEKNGMDWSSPSDQLKAGRIALEVIGECFRKGESFNQETTLSGRSALKNIRRAFNLGYRVSLFYIGVESADMALERIRRRVSLGGHDIGEEDVRRRAEASLRNFGDILDFTHYAAAYDNTEDLKCLAIWENGTLAWWGAGNKHTQWLAEAMQSEKWRA